MIQMLIFPWNTRAGQSNLFHLYTYTFSFSPYIRALADSRGMLSHDDVERLEPGRWANDAIMDWYIK